MIIDVGVGMREGGGTPERRMRKGQRQGGGFCSVRCLSLYDRRDLGNCYGSPAVAGGRTAVGERLGGGTALSSNCPIWSPRSWMARAPNCYMDVPRRARCYFFVRFEIL